MPETLPLRPGTSQRFALVEAMRGIAGLWVVGHHFIGERRPLGPADARWDAFYTVAERMLHTGTVAVDIFFILSGFVTAYNVNRARITAHYAANFALRRSVRLDLPYWTILGIAVCCGLVSRLVLKDSRAAVPGSWWELAANVFYLQTLCGFKSFLPVAWTLCIEFQFYLLFLATLAIAQQVPRWFRRASLEPASVVTVAFFPVAAYSVLVRVGVIPAGVRGLVFEYWCTLHLGLLLGWAYTGQIRERWLLGYALMLIACFAMGGDTKSLVATLLGMTLYLAGRMNYLVDGLNWRPVQYFGRLSFSLYLIHMVLGVRVLNLGVRWSGEHVSLPVAAGYLLLAVGVSVAAADLFNRWIEQPSQRLSRRFRLSATANARTALVAAVPAETMYCPANSPLGRRAGENVRCRARRTPLPDADG
jgi:peptidoglycan/LPS O-acetylase OafA/YrhL